MSDPVTNQILMFVIAQIGTAAGIYAAIRADLREHQVRIAILEKENERKVYSK